MSEPAGGAAAGDRDVLPHLRRTRVDLAVTLENLRAEASELTNLVHEIEAQEQAGAPAGLGAEQRTAILEDVRARLVRGAVDLAAMEAVVAQLDRAITALEHPDGSA